MLVLDQKLPQALILPDEGSELRTLLSAQGASWFSAHRQGVTLSEDGAVVELHSLTTTATARRTTPNKGHTRLEDEGIAFLERTHCGFLLPEAMSDATTWSCAIRFRAPRGEAKTLVTLNAENTENYVFLQQTDGRFTFKDQQSTQELSAPADAGDQTLLVLAGMSDGRLFLRGPDGALLRATGNRVHMDGPFTLFIGCRSNKGRLLKTLGDFHLKDILFWPDRNILSPGNEATLGALDAPAQWVPTP